MGSASNRRPVFRELDREASLDLLARNHVGRLAFTFRDRVDIEPIHYVYEDGWLYGRTAPGRKLATLAHHPWIAFEVDEVDGAFDWRSAVVHGTFYLLSPEDADQSEEALALARRLVPDTFTADDPVPFRTVLFRVHVSEISGRVASTHAASEDPSHHTAAASDDP